MQLFLNNFIYSTSLGEQDKTYINFSRWSTMVGLEPASIHMWVTNSSTVQWMHKWHGKTLVGDFKFNIPVKAECWICHILYRNTCHQGLVDALCLSSTSHGTHISISVLPTYCAWKSKFESGIPLMTLPSVIKDLLMFFASSNLSPVASVCFALSLQNKVVHMAPVWLLLYSRQSGIWHEIQ